MFASLKCARWAAFVRTARRSVVAMACRRPTPWRVVEFSPALPVTWHQGASLSTAVNSRSKDPADDFSEEQMRNIEKNTKLGLAILAVGFSGLATYIVFRWGPPRKNSAGEQIEDEYSHLPLIRQHIMRAWKECLLFVRYIKEPSREKLLPDKLQHPYYQPPITVLIEVNGLLVSPEWTYETGWRFKKRSGVEQFIKQIGYPNFELVFFTSESGFTASAILDGLDPNGVAMYRLFRDATRYLSGDHVKDLSCLNRDLSKVIMIDWNPRAVRLQPENLLRLPKWEGKDDNDLADLAALLKAMAASNVSDLRVILQNYSNLDDPVAEFRRRQQLLAETKKGHSVAPSDDSAMRRYANSAFRFGR